MSCPGIGRSLVHLFDEVARSNKKQRVLLNPSEKGGGHETLEWEELKERAEILAAGWVQAGLEPGQGVVLYLPLCQKWKIVELSVLMAGGFVVPVAAESPADRLFRIIEESRSPFLVTYLPQGLFRLARRDDRKELVYLKRIFYLPSRHSRSSKERPPIPTRLKSRLSRMSELHEAGKKMLDLDDQALDERVGLINDRTLAYLLYTPGTCSSSKGVFLDHGNLLVKAEELARKLPMDRGTTTLLSLPRDSAFGLAVFWTAVAQEQVIVLTSDELDLADDAMISKPVMIAARPLLYESVLRRASGLDSSASMPRRAVGEWARRKFDSTEGRGGGVRSKILREMASVVMRRSLARLMGGRARYLVCCGAPLHHQLAELYQRAGYELLHGYGLTETAGLTHLNPVGGSRPGTVGFPLPLTEVKLTHDGEIQVKGRCVFRGYCGSNERDGVEMDEEGFLSTGDLGIVEDGYLTITGRKRDVMVTTSGKQVVPSVIETALTGRAEIRNALALGDKKPCVVALVEPDFSLLWQLCGKTGKVRSDWDVALDPDAMDLMRKAVAEVNGKLSSHEQVRSFRIVTNGFREERGEVGRMGQPIRYVILHRYAEAVDEMYNDLQMSR